jgi:outer membrane protein assembly factor BamB
MRTTWRRAVAFLVLGAACSALAARTPLVEVDDPWPMFRREPAHGGDARDHRALAWEVAWSVELGERVDASPVVVESGVVVATRKGTVALLDPVTGAERARASLGGGIWATPAAARGVIVAGVTAAGGGGELVGLDARDLRVRWRRAVATSSTRAGRGKGRGVSFSAGTADGDRVLLCQGATLVAVHVDDGRELARHETGPCFGAPGLDGDTVYVATRGGELVAHPRDLALRHDVTWRVAIGARDNNDTAPVVTDELVLVGSNNGFMYAFARADGALRWKVGDGDWVVSAPAIADGLAIFGDDGDVVRAVSLADGSERWRGAVGGDVASSAVVIGEHVVHGAHDGKVHAWRLADGAPLPPIEAGAAMFASPAVTREGVLVIATHRGRVLAIR